MKPALYKVLSAEGVHAYSCMLTGMLTRIANVGIHVCLCAQVELSVVAIHVVSRAAGALPFELVDAARSEVRGGGTSLFGNKFWDVCHKHFLQVCCMK
jgi:hypothetical protein